MSPRCLTMLVAAAAMAQTPAPPPTGEPASIAGIVTNALTGEPILRAHVSLRGNSASPGQIPQTYGALTNGEGKFTIASLPPGTYMLSVDRVGFVSQPANGNTRATNYTLAAGEKRDDLKVTLTPLGAITGRVMDAAGEPMSGVQVIAEGTELANTSTDDRGQFRLGGLAPGKYRVKASPENLPFPPEVRSDGTQETHYSPTYYANGLNAKSAERIDVKSGADASGIDIRLLSPPLIRVSGKVTGLPPGAKGTYVMAQQTSPNGGNTGAGSVVKPDGSFEIWSLAPGKYTLEAVSTGQSGPGNLQSSPLEIEVTSGNLDHLELQMVPAFAINGLVRYEDDQARQAPRPPPGRSGQPPRTQPPMQRRVHLQADVPSDAATADIGADDTFIAEKVQPGRYHVSLFGGNGFVKSVRAGDTEVEGDILDARNGAPGPVTILVSSNFAEISGTVTDLKGPVPGATVILTNGSNFRQNQADASGVYHVMNLAPGKYSLVAVEDGANIPRRLDDLDDYENSLENVDLRAGDKISKDLKQRQPGK